MFSNIVVDAEFAAMLQSKLSDALDAQTIDLLLADTSHHIQLIHNAAQSGSTGPLPQKLAKQVERQGRDLWNLCIRLRRELDASGPIQKSRLLVKARSLAFYMLEHGRSAGRAKEDEGTEAMYLMNMALALGKLCVRDADLDSARTALQKAAELMERLKAVPPGTSDLRAQKERTRLDAEYLAMRTALSWKEDRLDVAEHMFGKIDALRPNLDSISAEIIADTLQHIGFDLASKGDHGMAVKWLKRAYDIINHQALDQLSAKGLELRLAICQGLVRGLLDVGSHVCVQEAQDLVEYIESEIGDKPLVLHWRLELLQWAPGEAFDVDAYSSILHRMVRSFDYSDASFYFLLHHIRSLGERSPRLARGLLDELLLQHVVSSKKSEWIGKVVVRRLWMVTTGTADLIYDADEIEPLTDLHNLLDRDHILTRYLTFKVSLVDWDHDLGCESIKHLSKLSDSSQGRDVLYACIREAQQVGDKLCTLAALQAIIDSWKSEQVSPSNLTSILRCSIRLIHKIEEEGSADAGSQSITYADDICKLFEKAAERANQEPKDDDGNILFTISELHWFRKNAYNMALMALRCHFVIAAALVSLARTEDRVEEQLQYYLEARHHVKDFDATLEKTSDGIQDENIRADLIAKLSTLFVFDFEAATVLKIWDGLNEIVRKTKMCRDEGMYKAMGDCMLRSRAPGKALFSTMRLIINEMYELKQFDYEKLAKYIRCMFQAILGLDDTCALQLVDQAIQIAREGNETGTQLPSAELEWLVATTFNHAIDYYARGEEEPCHRWALKAMHLAEYVGDGGLLRDTLQDKFAKLQFDGLKA
ncbi:SPO22-domain-containing protein [Trichoderma citrinoviride]|uniref:Protein ZIP4 homolog n=1 Tax=Trichoderma citrinoviride TaxID=58853 RepID=A0A2T4B380_9HYPO|nr:SPO22-domain-containing protein [Trichoderma citrinoviride]PTB63793.1 SPO22-domain-containing protein [Trichoderma citrinoviride]